MKARFELFELLGTLWIITTAVVGAAVRRRSDDGHAQRTRTATKRLAHTRTGRNTYKGENVTDFENYRATPASIRTGTLLLQDLERDPGEISNTDGRRWRRDYETLIYRE